MLSKVRHFVDKNTLALIYHAIFESHLFYTCLGSAQNTNFLKRLCFEKEISRLMYFLNRNTDTAPLFKDSHMLKFPEKTCLEIIFFISNYFNQTSPTSFKNWFTLSANSRTHNTRWSNLSFLKIPPHKTKIYRIQSLNISAINIWNYLHRIHKDTMFYQLSLNKLNNLIMQYYFSNYD